MKQIIRTCGLLLLALILFAEGVFAQIDTVRFNKQYFKKYWIDTKAIVTSPVRWDGKDWTKLGVFVVAEGGIIFSDKSVKNYFQDHKTGGLDNVSKNLLEPFGGNYSLLIMSGFLAHGLLAKNSKSVSTGLLSLESFLLASVLVRIPKTLAGRQRPDVATDQFQFKGPFHGNSFPSGHTTAVFSVASVIATQYRETKWVPVAAYSVASLVGLSRIYDNKHWLSDVVAGAAVGTLVGNLVSHRSPDSRITVVPIGSSNFQGVQLTYCW
ncbi:MAG: phosphatase PAP2 family protein [Prolixibacteraceae bacterium]|jgi:hypothetical protein